MSQPTRKPIAQEPAVLSQAQKNEFNENGYLILRGAFNAAPAFIHLVGELERYCQTFASDFNLSKPESVLSLPTEQRSTLYRGLRYLPSLYRLASDTATLSISQALGLAFPGIEMFNNIRMDLPDEDRHLFQWHQDITYNLGSINGVTYWIPLSQTGAHHGGIEVVPGSHKRGLWPCEVVNPDRKVGLLSTRDVVIKEQPKTPATTIETNFGDVVVFSQLLMHRSLSNRSQNIRWTVQIRHCDFMDPYFRRAGFPMGDMMTLDKTTYLKEWTEDHGQS